MSEEAREEQGKAAEIAPETANFYRFCFREGGQHFTGFAESGDFPAGTVVMVRTDHGLEPGIISGPAAICCCRGETRRAYHVIERLATVEERDKHAGLAENERRAQQFCEKLIGSHQLSMNLVRVERYCNGGKMIFYFTAESRVDFRGLVKDLVQEFRTRVEMRQVGVRHETKMIGGIGTCGRELCCSSFIRNFDSVSIKMAKEQDLPLNPTKISGVCNRLLCCLTYEYETYRKLRKNMPKTGKRVKIEGEEYLVKRQNPLQETILAESAAGEELVLGKRQWKTFQPLKKETIDKKRERRSGESPGASPATNDQENSPTPPLPESDRTT